MSVKNRIKEFVKYHNITISSFEGSINASNGYVNSISKSVGLDKIDSILEKYPNINLEWLLTGKGEMLKSGESPVHKSEDCSKYIESAEERKYTIDVQRQLISKLENEINELKKESKSIISHKGMASNR